MIYLEEAKVKPVPKKTNKKAKPKTMLGRCGALFSRDSQFLLFGRFWLAVFLGLVGIAQCTLSIYLLLAGADPTIVKVAQALAIGAACFGIQPITLRLCHILFKVSTITTLRTMKKSYGALELAVYLIGFWLWPATAALQLYLWFSGTITWQAPQNSSTSGQTLFIVFQVSTVLSLISCVLVWLLVISWPMQYMQFEEKRSMMFSPQTTLRDDDSIFNYTAKWKKGYRDYPTLSPLAKVAFPPSAEKNLYNPTGNLRRDSEPAPFNPDALVAHSTPPRRIPTSTLDYTPTAPLLPRKSQDETREKREQITSSLYSFDETTPKQEKELSELEASFLNSANRRRRQAVPRVPTIPNMWLQKESTSAHANSVHPPLPPPHGIHPAFRRPSEPIPAQLITRQISGENIERRSTTAPQTQPQPQPFAPAQAHIRSRSGPTQPPVAHIAELLRQPSVQQYNSAVPVRKPTLVNISRSPSLINRQNSVMNRALPSLPAESQPHQPQFETTLEPTNEEHELVPPPRHPLHTRTSSSPPTPLTLEAFPPFDFSLGGLFPEAVTPVAEIRDPLTTPRGDEVFPLSLRKMRSSIVGGMPNAPASQVELGRTSTVVAPREKKPQGYRRARARTGPSTTDIPAMPSMPVHLNPKMRIASGLGVSPHPIPGSQAGGPGVRIRHPGD